MLMKYSKPKLLDMNFQIHSLCANGGTATGSLSGDECGVGAGGDTVVWGNHCAAGATDGGGAYATCSGGMSVGASKMCFATGSAPSASGGGS
jgi:hypothetical protein